MRKPRITGSPLLVKTCIFGLMRKQNKRCTVLTNSQDVWKDSWAVLLKSFGPENVNNGSVTNNMS